MNELKINGKQNFMGIEIPVVSGGFGADKKCISDKTIADIHDMKTFHVRESINENIKRFTEGVDYIDLKRIGDVDTLIQLGYSKQSITQAEHIYILSRKGYGKVIKIFNTDLAWEIYDRLLDEYFAMEETINQFSFKPLSTEEMLRCQLGMIDKNVETLEEHESRIDNLEQHMTIDYGQQLALEDAVKVTVLGALGGKESNAYRVASKKVFAECNRDLKHYFNVNSRNNIPKLKFNEAIDYLKVWKPCTNTLMQINIYNNQIRLEDIS